MISCFYHPIGNAKHRRAPFELACKPSPASSTPAFARSSLNLPIEASSLPPGQYTISYGSRKEARTVTDALILEWPLKASGQAAVVRNPNAIARCAARVCGMRCGRSRARPRLKRVDQVAPRVLGLHSASLVHCRSEGRGLRSGGLATNLKPADYSNHSPFFLIS